MSDESEERGNFLGRWSERKTAERIGQPLAEEEVSEKSELAVAEADVEIADEDLPIPDDLPDIETLDKDSDFSLFMRKGTPEHLKRMALRKLFQSDPALAVLDGLNDYDEDYSMIGMVAEAVSTRYQPGKGMVDPDTEKAAEELETAERDQPEEKNEETPEEIPKELPEEEADESPDEETETAETEEADEDIFDDDGELEG